MYYTGQSAAAFRVNLLFTRRLTRLLTRTLRLLSQIETDRRMKMKFLGLLALAAAAAQVCVRSAHVQLASVYGRTTLPHRR